ncbi:MAG: hypothetical protein Q4F80_06860 [bacterium]|nr:hypothetical protein [bacterium]
MNRYYYCISHDEINMIKGRYGIKTRQLKITDKMNKKRKTT